MQILVDEGKEKTNYQTYLTQYGSRLKDNLLDDGLKVNKFINEYKDEIIKVLNTNDIFTRKEYITFLNDSRDVIMSSARFCRGNIEFFRSQIDAK